MMRSWNYSRAIFFSRNEKNNPESQDFFPIVYRSPDCDYECILPSADSLCHLQTFSETSTNTDTKEEENDDDTSYEYDEALLNKMNDDINNAISALHGETDVIHDAWREIQKLREEVNCSTEVAVPGNTPDKDKNTVEDKRGDGRNGRSCDVIDSLQSQDPAILMSSVDVSQRNFWYFFSSFDTISLFYIHWEKMQRFTLASRVVDRGCFELNPKIPVNILLTDTDQHTIIANQDSSIFWIEKNILPLRCIFSQFS